MNVKFRVSFANDLKNAKDKGLLKRVREIIESVEKADSLAELSNLRKLRGSGITFVCESEIIESAFRLRMTL